MADEDLQRRSVFTYYIGAKQKFWEEVRNPRTRVPITANTVIGRLWNRDDNTSVAIAETIRISSGLVEVTLPYTYMTAPANFQIEWDIAYTDGLDTPTITIYTDIIAQEKDSTYLIGLVPRMRTWVDDDPEDKTKRIKSDIKYKPYMEDAVRYNMSGYSLTDDADGNKEIDSEPAAESDDEKLLVLWAAWRYYRFGYTAIARERTRMFSIGYDEAYTQMRERIEAIEDEIVKLDDTQAMYFASETSIEYWGQINTRTNEAIATWNDVS
jgi:hypothetical protein